LEESDNRLIQRPRNKFVLDYGSTAIPQYSTLKNLAQKWLTAAVEKPEEKQGKK
jgi:ribosomal protein S24E